MADMKAGERRRCAGCGTEIVVIKPDGSVPRCCGEETDSVSAAPGGPSGGLVTR